MTTRRIYTHNDMVRVRNSARAKTRACMKEMMEHDRTMAATVSLFFEESCREEADAAEESSKAIAELTDAASVNSGELSRVLGMITAVDKSHVAELDTLSLRIKQYETENRSLRDENTTLKASSKKTTIPQRTADGQYFIDLKRCKETCTIRTEERDHALSVGKDAMAKCETLEGRLSALESRHAALIAEIQTQKLEKEDKYQLITGMTRDIFRETPVPDA